MAAADAREAAVLDLMRRRFDHVSAERVLSGPGLINLYAALCELSGEPIAELAPPRSPTRARGVAHPRAREATAMFCAMLGTVAGNLALTLGARGGIYIAGGIVPRLGATFAQSDFRARFEAKGRFATTSPPSRPMSSPGRFRRCSARPRLLDGVDACGA